MPAFGKSSQGRLDTTHSLLKELFRRVVEERDCSVVCGHRPNDTQDALYAQGRTAPGDIVTNAKAGESTHNSFPSMGVDVVPYPELWSSPTAFAQLSVIVLEKWAEMEIEGLTNGYELVWGGDWDGDRDPNDTDQWDKPHWEVRHVGT